MTMDFFDDDVEIVLPPDDDGADPHIRLVGTPENVTLASHMVRQQLEPHNKITMKMDVSWTHHSHIIGKMDVSWTHHSHIIGKMDVSWTHHSHIIGKAGNTIQPVVRRTGVSIHFPDGNKNNEIRKSNQVSINSRGEELGGLEEARASIRLLTPLVFTFTLNANADFIAISEPNALVQHVQSLYNVQVELCVTVDQEPMIVGSVRGSETDVSRVKEATLTLLKMLCGPIGNHLNVQMKIEVSPQHHSYVLGRSNETLKRIMQTTSTTIRFPDAADPQLGPLQRSTVTISGAIDNVYAARQNIVGALPLVLMFEVPNDSFNTEDMTQLMQSFNLVIIPKPARPDGRRPVIIKGAEKDAAHIYEAWKLVTQSDKKLPSVMIPPSYHIAQAPLPSVQVGGRCGVWGSSAPPARTSNSSVSGFPFTAPLPSPHSPTFLPTTPAFHPTTPAFPNSSPSFTYSSTSPLFNAMMRSGPSPLWPSAQPALLNTRFPFPTPRQGQHFPLPPSSEGSNNFFANVAALSSLSAANPVSFFSAPEGNLFNTTSSAQFGYTPSSGDKLNNNYMGHNSNFVNNPVLDPRALLSLATDDHNADNMHQKYASAPQRVQQQQQAALARAGELRSVWEEFPSSQPHSPYAAVCTPNDLAATASGGLFYTSQNGMTAQDNSRLVNRPISSSAVSSAASAYRNLMAAEDCRSADVQTSANLGVIGDRRRQKPLDSMYSEQQECTGDLLSVVHEAERIYLAEEELAYQRRQELEMRQRLQSVGHLNLELAVQPPVSEAQSAFWGASALSARPHVF
ncbi:K domain type 1 [Trinorchestia longiramus]|nr:K domain type 1 [Trinorchestia longiramus]